MGRSLPHQSFDPTYFALLFQIEDRHFWFRARNQVVATVAKRLTAGMSRGYRVLEVGCGTGNVLRVLEQVCTSGTVVGVDLFSEGLHYARQRTDALLVQGDIRTVPFGVPFDLIGLFDVLEHLPDDHRVLRNLHDVLAKGGRLLLTVPAHPCLWSRFDEASCHCRRYELAELEGKLIHAGYRVEYITQYMASIFPLVWLRRRVAGLADLRPSAGAGRRCDLVASELRIVPVINDLLVLLLAQEARLIARRCRLPVGTSLLAVARRDSM